MVAFNQSGIGHYGGVVSEKITHLELNVVVKKMTQVEKHIAMTERVSILQLYAVRVAIVVGRIVGAKTVLTPMDNIHWAALQYANVPRMRGSY